jgi:O-antigen ligase
MFIHRPFEVWPALGELHIERAYMLVTLVFWALFAAKGWVSNRLNPAFLAFIMAMIVAWLASPYPEEGREAVENYIKTAVFYVLVLSTVRDERQLRWLILMFLVAMGLYMAHSLREFFNGRYEYRMGIVRMMGVDSTYSNPNSFAASILCALPLTFPFWAQARSLRQRFLLASYTALTVLCIVLTGSRGNLVGLLCLAAVAMISSQRRVRMLVLLAVVLPAGWFALPVSLQHRFLTLIDPSYGPKNAQESAEFRSQALTQGVKLWGRSPVTGFGPFSFGKAAGHGYQAHNLYAQAISEVGSLGTLAFAAIVWGFAANAAEMRRLCRWIGPGEDDFPCRVSRAISISVILLLVLGFSGHNLYRYNWMWFGAFQAVALHCQRERVRQVC